MLAFLSAAAIAGPLHLQLQLGNGTPIRAAALSPDGNRLATGSDDRRVVVWDLASRRVIGAFPFGVGAALAWASPSELVVITQDGGGRYDVASGALLERLDHASAPTWDLDVAPDGSRYAYVDAEHCVHVVPDPGTAPRCDSAWGVRLAGPSLVTFDRAHAVAHLWRDGVEVPVGPVQVPALSPDGETLVATVEDGDGAFLEAHDTSSGSVRWRLPTPGGLMRLGVDDELVVAQPYLGSGAEVRELATGELVGAIDAPEHSAIRMLGHGRAVVVTHEGAASIVELRSGAAEPWSPPSRATSASVAAIAGDRGYVGLGDGRVAIWDLADLSIDGMATACDTNPARLVARRDGRLLVACPEENRVVAVNTDGTRRWWTGANAVGVAWTADAALIATTDGSLVRLDADTGEQLDAVELGRPLIDVDAVGERIAVLGGGLLQVFDGDPHAPSWQLDVSEEAWDVALSADGRRVAVSEAGDVATADVGSDAPPLRGAVPPMFRQAVAFAADGAVLTMGEDALIRIDREGASRVVGTVPIHGGGVAVRADGLVLTSGWADQATLWRLGAEGAEHVALAADADDAWVVYAPDGLFDASHAGTQLVAVVQDGHAYPIDQFAAQTNRPDVLLERMGLGGRDRVEYFRTRVQRRIERMGITAEALDARAPRAGITSHVTVGEVEQLGVIAEPADRPLVRIDVFVDGVPAGSAPVAPAGGTVDIPVALSAGTQTIEVVAVDDAGLASPRASLAIDGPARPRSLWFVGFGVSDYADPALPDLGLADDDARALDRAFRHLDGFAAVHTRTFLDDDVTPSSVAEARAFLEQAALDDVVVVFVAGHGLHAQDPAATYYFLPHDASLADLPGTAITLDALVGLVDGIASRNRLVLLDTCASGELDEVAGPVALDNKSRGVARGVTLHTAAGAGYGARPWIYDRDRFVYDDLVRSGGAVVFSSARGGEYAYESASVGHGYFTAEILAALADRGSDLDRDGVISIEELRRTVADHVDQLSKGYQHPVVDHDNPEARIGFPAPDRGRR
jgi:WD40 repeat protein